MSIDPRILNVGHTHLQPLDQVPLDPLPTIQLLGLIFHDTHRSRSLLLTVRCYCTLLMQVLEGIGDGPGNWDPNPHMGDLILVHGAFIDILELNQLTDFLSLSMSPSLCLSALQTKMLKSNTKEN